MPQIRTKPTKVKKTKKAQKPVPRVSVKTKSKPKAQTKSLKNPVAYFECMSACCQGKISPKRISQVAHECKTNALAVNKKVSAEKLKEVKKLGASFNEFKRNLEEFVKKSVK